LLYLKRYFKKNFERYCFILRGKMGEQQNKKIPRFMRMWRTIDSQERLSLLSQTFDLLTARELREVRDLAEQKRQTKVAKTKNQLLEHMRPHIDELGIDPDEVAVTFIRPRKQRKDTGRKLPVKYRGPKGENWTGRGCVPVWLQALEAQGYSRDDFLVNEGEEISS
jgi:DNA-binding protein H-NS